MSDQRRETKITSAQLVNCKRDLDKAYKTMEEFNKLNNDILIERKLELSNQVKSYDVKLQNQ